MRNTENDDTVEDTVAEADNNNNSIELMPTTKKNLKRLSMFLYSILKIYLNYYFLDKSKHTKKSGPTIWINNRQKPTDYNKYCSFCRHEFSKRSNFLMHVRNIHKGILPPLLTEQDQSLLEMNVEHIEKNFNENITDILPCETTNDQLGK